MDEPKSIPVQGILRLTTHKHAPPLELIFTKFWDTLDAVTTPQGCDVQIKDDLGAMLLSDVTQELHNALACEFHHYIARQGTKVDASEAGVRLWASAYPDGRDAVPLSSVTVRTIDLQTIDDKPLYTAITRAMDATGCPVDRHNAQNALKPGGPHPRYLRGDVITRDTLDTLNSVSRLLQLRVKYDDRERHDSDIPQLQNTELDDLVTLDQAAAVCVISKRTLERYLQDGHIPAPDFPGGNGRSHKWRWSAIRPALQKHCRADLPARYPSSRII